MCETDEASSIECVETGHPFKNGLGFGRVLRTTVGRALRSLCRAPLELRGFHSGEEGTHEDFPVERANLKLFIGKCLHLHVSS